MTIYTVYESAFCTAIVKARDLPVLTSNKKSIKENLPPSGKNLSLDRIVKDFPLRKAHKKEILLIFHRTIDS